MDDNFVNEDDEHLIKTLLKNKPTFSEDLIDFYLSYNGCKVNEKSCLRLISLVLHKSLDNLINNALNLQSTEISNNKKEIKNISKEKELNYKELIKALKEYDENYENEEIFKNFNVFLE
ncbi:transcription initiation factor TFIID subunit 10, putative [Plasmodium relictum]|uniref:Transcription initiation factor TFIID subunit 10, putative n=1 Tax=Plasmodium relictum TaxID=85471 RepID=A0A1J1HAH9_PLARL|nr:transcription initiation factor TFIID subunit 10, putative [Plasmodium relictum]CRH00442.1 transcription initiation factor TFIID subunit 10, putative [Plasmodium relictum]